MHNWRGAPMADVIEIFTLGRLIVDLYADQLHTPLAEVKSFSKYLGGSAANTAFGLARLGARVGLISRVGPDEFGEFLLARLHKEGVEMSMVAVDLKYRAVLAGALIIARGVSKVLFYRARCADTHLAVDDIDMDLLRQAKILSIAATALCDSPSREAVSAALEEHRRAG